MALLTTTPAYSLQETAIVSSLTRGTTTLWVLIATSCTLRIPWIQRDMTALSGCCPTDGSRGQDEERSRCGISANSPLTIPQRKVSSARALRSAKRILTLGETIPRISRGLAGHCLPLRSHSLIPDWRSSAGTRIPPRPERCSLPLSRGWWTLSTIAERWISSMRASALRGTWGMRGRSTTFRRARVIATCSLLRARMGLRGCMMLGHRCLRLLSRRVLT